MLVKEPVLLYAIFPVSSPLMVEEPKPLLRVSVYLGVCVGGAVKFTIKVEATIGDAAI